MKLTKMEGCGNDFVFVEMNEIEEMNRKELAIRLCNRSSGIGADGMICVKRNPLEFIYYNSDGSTSPFCGNGMRCFAKFCVMNHLVDENEFKVICDRWNVKCRVENENITVYLPDDAIEESENQEEIFIVCGSRHKVVETEDLKNASEIQSDEYNLSYVKWENKSCISIKTIERGAGLTLACGSGSYASALKMKKLKKILNKITVKNPGGDIKIDLKKKSLSGPANKITEFEWNETA